MSKGTFEKLQPIPRNLEANVHFPDCAYAQERPEKILRSLSTLFEYLKNSKLRIRQSGRLPAKVLKM